MRAVTRRARVFSHTLKQYQERIQFYLIRSFNISPFLNTMKVYVQIGSSKEKIDFNLKPSDTIGDVKAKIAEDRAIPIYIQRLFGNYQEFVEDGQHGLNDKTKLYQIDKNGKTRNRLLSMFYKGRSPDEYLHLYLYSRLEINVKTFPGYEFSIDVDLDSHLRISSIKSKIYKDQGFPSALQKLYIGYSDMDELGDHEPVCSPQILEDICESGIILRLTGKVPLRNITRGANSKVEYPVINAMDKISRIKQNLSRQDILLYIDGTKIQNLQDNKRLFQYDLRNLLSNGLLMKVEPSMMVFVRTLRSETVTFYCDAGDLVAGLQDKITDMEGMPAKDQRLIYGGKQLEPNKTLSEYGIKRESTIQLLARLNGS